MAGARVTVKIIGEKELVTKLRALEASIAGGHLVEAARAASEVVRTEASRRAPRRTGKLASSIVAEIRSKSRDRAEISVGPGKEAFYGMFVEMGTSKMAAQPFLRPALDESRAEVEASVRDELRKRILGVAT
jgi:HK97 gp10 family phage protein